MAGYDDIYDDVYEGDVAGTLVLDGNLFLSIPQFFQGTVAGPLTGVLFQSTPSFFTGTVTTSATVTGTLFTKAPTFFTGSILSTATLTGVLFQKAPTFPTGTITGGTPFLLGQLFQKAPTFFVGSLVADQVLAGFLFQSTPVFYQGVLSTPGGIVRPFLLVVTFQNRQLTITGVQSIMTVGETSTPQGYFIDADGTAYDPDSVSARVRDPSGVETFPTPLQVGTGVYRFPFIGTDEGVWRGWITGEGPGDDVVIESFSVCFVDAE